MDRTPIRIMESLKESHREEINVLHNVINEYKNQQLQDEKTIQKLKDGINDYKEILIIAVDKLSERRPN
jgi:UDP-N-acetyl-D-mannosaminuronate dehydrogenase